MWLAVHILSTEPCVSSGMLNALSRAGSSQVFLEWTKEEMRTLSLKHKKHDSKIVLWMLVRLITSSLILCLLLPFTNESLPTICDRTWKSHRNFPGKHVGWELSWWLLVYLNSVGGSFHQFSQEQERIFILREVFLKGSILD